MTIASERPGAVTLAEVLEMPAVRLGLPEVLAGEESLDRVVRWAHVVDLPNPQRLLQGRELVLTTGVGFRPNEQTQRRWVESVAAQGASGIALELGIAFDKRVPDAIVEACRAASMPLIVFRRRVAFVDLTEAIHSAILDANAATARITDELESRLVDLLLADQGVSVALDELASQLRAPVALETLNHELVYCAEGSAPASLALKALADFHRFEAASDEGTAITVELPRHGGRLVALGIDGPFDDVHRTMLARAARILGLDHSTKAQAVTLNARSKGRLLSGLLSRQLSEREIGDHAALLGLRAGPDQVAPMVARLRAPRRASAYETWAALIPALRKAFVTRGTAALIGLSGEDLVALIGRPNDSPTARDEIALVVREVAADYASVSPNEILLVIGEGGPDWGTLGVQLERARRRARAAAALPSQPWFDPNDSDVLELLHEIRDTSILSRFVDEQLGPLLELPGNRRDPLLETLRILIEHRGRKASAARALHLDRGSLYPRLERIEQALGVDLDDSRTILTLHLALEARALLQTRDV